MFDDTEPRAIKQNTITLNSDLSTFSLEDLDKRVEMLEQEISRLKAERVSKESSLDAAQAFFKS